MDKVIGYKDHTSKVVEVVNVNKKFENDLGNLIDSIRNNESVEIDKRWVSIAVTHFQQGFMALNRAVFQPESNLK